MDLDDAVGEIDADGGLGVKVWVADAVGELDADGGHGVKVWVAKAAEQLQLAASAGGCPS